MKEVVFGALALGVVGFGIYKGAPSTSAPNTYEMTREQAIEKLLDAPIKPSNRAFESPFGNLDVVTRNPSPESIIWRASGAHGSALCEATLTPVEATHVRVELDCGAKSPSDGAAEGARGEMIAIGMQEYIASTLEDRPYNSQKVMAASTARFAKEYPGMVDKALDMDAEMREMQRQER